MIAVEKDKQDANSRWEQQKPTFGKHVRVEIATALSLVPHAILLDMVRAVQRREINIRRRVVNVDVVVSGAENAKEQGQRVVQDIKMKTDL